MKKSPENDLNQSKSRVVTVTENPTKYIVSFDSLTRAVHTEFQPAIKCGITKTRLGHSKLPGTNISGLDNGEDAGRKIGYLKFGRRKQSTPRKIVRNIEEKCESTDIVAEGQQIEHTDLALDIPVSSLVLKDSQHYKCNICFKDFSDAESFKSHKSSMHNEEKQLFCVNIGGSFSLQTFLNSQPAPDDRNCLSEVATLTSYRNSKRKRVLSSHEEENTFKFMIDDSSKMKDHKCKVCQKTFAIKSSLKKHLVTHKKRKKFTCEVCGRVYAQKSHLTYHMITHTAVKNFVCEKCGKRFGSMLHLRRHTHARSKDFQCEFCYRSFTRKEALINHISIFHKDIDSIVPATVWRAYNDGTAPLSNI